MYFITSLYSALGMCRSRSQDTKHNSEQAAWFVPGYGLFVLGYFKFSTASQSLLSYHNFFLLHTVRSEPRTLAADDFFFYFFYRIIEW